MQGRRKSNLSVNFAKKLIVSTPTLVAARVRRDLSVNFAKEINSVLSPRRSTEIQGAAKSMSRPECEFRKGPGN